MIINLEGLDVQISDIPIRLSVGDLYVAKRNADWKLLTVKCFGKWGERDSENKPTIVKTDNWDEANMVFPVENGYPFDTYETRKVLSI